MPMQYKLPYVLRAPSDDTEGMYLAEAPIHPGPTRNLNPA